MAAMPSFKKKIAGGSICRTAIRLDIITTPFVVLTEKKFFHLLYNQTASLSIITQGNLIRKCKIYGNRHSIFGRSKCKQSVNKTMNVKKQGKY